MDTSCFFDSNRVFEEEYVLIIDPKTDIEAIFGDTSLPFTLSLVTNTSKKNFDIIVCQKYPENSKINEISLGLKWPRGLYSLLHVVLPFPMNDQLYSKFKPGDSTIIYFGNIDFAESVVSLRYQPQICFDPPGIRTILIWENAYLNSFK